MSRLSLRTNIASLKAQRQLSESTRALSRSFERLSSGLRINSASDDAAGLQLSTKLRGDEVVYRQGVRNVNDGISILSVAEGALREISSVTTRLKELATQASNGSLSLTERQAIDEEGDALVEEFNRIVDSVDYNQKNLLDGTFGSSSVQAGFGELGRIVFELGEELKQVVNDGSFAGPDTYSIFSNANGITLGDINYDGSLDIVVSEAGNGAISVFLNDGSGSFGPVMSYESTPGSSYTPETLLYDFDGDGYLDLAAAAYSTGPTVSILSGNADGSFSAGVSYDLTGSGLIGAEYINMADVNNDSVMDLILSRASDGNASLLLGNGDGSFNAATTIFTSSSAYVYEVTPADFNNDGNADIAIGQGDDLRVLLGAGDGTFSSEFTLGGADDARSIQAEDLNDDGILDIVTTSHLDSDIVVYFGNGDGSFTAKTSYAVGGVVEELALSDLNGDGILDIADRKSVV